MKKRRFPGKRARRILTGTVSVLCFLMLWGCGGTHEVQIVLEQDGSRILGEGARVEEGDIVISQGGTYILSGVLEEGQIYVDVRGGGRVALILDGLTIRNSQDAAIYVENAGSVLLQLGKDTENLVQSGKEIKPGDRERMRDKEASGGAIYARTDLTVTGEGQLRVKGDINNGIHTTKRLQIENGSITVEAVNKAVKGKDAVTIKGGVLRIIDSYEGVESPQIVIEDGTVEVAAREDGMNANGEAAREDGRLPSVTVRGGVVAVNADGDGLDSNGDIKIEGGSITVDGPVEDDNGPLDFGKENGGKCVINGGTVMAVGSSGMAETFEEDSGQSFFRCYLPFTFQPGDDIVISDSAGKELFRHQAVKTGSSVVFSSPELVSGQIYTVEVGERKEEICAE